MKWIACAVLLLMPLAGCLDDEDDGDAPDFSGLRGQVPESASAFGMDAMLEMPGSSTGIWVHDGILYHTNNVDLTIVDVRDPTDPVLLASLPEITARDVDILEWEGRTYALLAASSTGIHVVDVTEPSDPRPLSTTALPSAGAHNLAAVPGTPYVYSSGASGNTRAIDVLDISNPRAPTTHTFGIPDTLGGLPVQSDGCHDIWVRADLNRAYCAGGGSQYVIGGGESFVWDITDPTAPVWLSMMDDPRILYHHQAFVNDAGTIMIIDDEYVGLWPYTNGVLGGVYSPGANNCIAQDTPLPSTLDVQVPFAAAWIWDISDETSPSLLGMIQNPTGWDGGVPPNPLEGNCGSHFGAPIPGHDAFVMGWYDGGTMLVDYSDPSNPAISDIFAAPGETWDAQYSHGHIFHAADDLHITPFL